MALNAQLLTQVQILTNDVQVKSTQYKKLVPNARSPGGSQIEI